MCSAGRDGNPPKGAAERILEAALRRFGEHGSGGAGIRGIAADAGVSPALVLHHFGSKQGLRTACDERLMVYVTDKESFVTSGSFPDMGDYLAAHPQARDVLAYLRRVLSDGGPTASRLFEALHAETQRVLELGREAGTVRPLADLPGTAAVLTAWSLGALMVQQDLGRVLGGDLFTQPAAGRYSVTGLDLLTSGLFTSPAPKEKGSS